MAVTGGMITSDRTKESRDTAIQAFHILNYFVGDLVVASRIRRHFQSLHAANQASSAPHGAVNRMCLSYLFLTLDKWDEFYRHFHPIIPDSCRNACRQLRDEINRLGIKRFRNTVVGHIWDKKRNRPLTDQEIEEAVNIIVKNDPDAFEAWCNNPDGNHFPETVISIIEHTRDRIRADYRLDDVEVFPSQR